MTNLTKHLNLHEIQLQLRTTAIGSLIWSRELESTTSGEIRAIAKLLSGLQRMLRKKKERLLYDTKEGDISPGFYSSRKTTCRTSDVKAISPVILVIPAAEVVQFVARTSGENLVRRESRSCADNLARGYSVSNFVLLPSARNPVERRYDRIMQIPFSHDDGNFISFFGIRMLMPCKIFPSLHYIRTDILRLDRWTFLHDYTDLLWFDVIGVKKF